MQNNPRLSIIVPVYNVEKYLPDCIDSILQQKFKDFEVILINDGSSDISGLICDDYAQKDDRIMVFHKKNGGASSARNVGLAIAKGEYIGWVDADDKIAPDMYYCLFKLAEDYKAAIAECQYLEVKDNQTTKSGPDRPIAFGKDDFILREFFSSRMKPSLCTKIYKREIWDSIRFPLGRNHQDFYVNARIVLNPIPYVRISDAKYFYMIRDNSITTTRTSRELRETVYKYDYTMDLAENIATTKLAKLLLKKDAIRRFMSRFYDVSINSSIGNQYVYNHLVRKKLKFKLVKYFLFARLPMKTRVSQVLLLLNLKQVQLLIHNIIAKNI